MAGYHRGTPELRARAVQVMRERGGALQNYELASIALAENWPIHHQKMWGTHGILNTLREEGLVVKVGKGRYALVDSKEARDVKCDSQWDAAKGRILRATMQTVARSGTTTTRRLKGKELRCVDLQATLDELAQRQAYKCAQTGVSFSEYERDLRASLDRIDSDGHYEDGTLPDGVNNLQLVTHWYNMAKGTRTDAQMKRLLGVHASQKSAVASYAAELGSSADGHDRLIGASAVFGAKLNDRPTRGESSGHDPGDGENDVLGVGIAR